MSSSNTFYSGCNSSAVREGSLGVAGTRFIERACPEGIGRRVIRTPTSSSVFDRYTHPHTVCTHHTGIHNRHMYIRDD